MVELLLGFLVVLGASVMIGLIAKVIKRGAVSHLISVSDRIENKMEEWM